MERITAADIKRLSETLSKDLPENLHLEVQGRNGYFGLDLYDPSGLRDTLHIGTRREIYTYMQGMRRFSLLNRYSA